MVNCWTVAKHTHYVHAQGAGWNEPQIGHGVYGEMRDLPPVFMKFEDAVKHAESITECNVSVVEMVLKS